MAHYPGYVPMNMMMHQPYMVALRFPAGMPPSAAGQQYLQGLQGVPVTLGQTSGVPPHLSGTPLQAGVTFSAAALSQSMGAIQGGVPGLPGTLSAIPGGLAGMPGFSSGGPVSMASMASAMGTMGTMGMTMTGIPVSASAQGLLGTPTPPAMMTVAHTPTPPLADSLSQGFAQPILTQHVSSDRKRKLDDGRSQSLLGLPAQHLQMHIPLPLPQEEIEYDPDAPNVDETMVVLDHYNSDLYLALDSDGFGAKPLTEPSGFCFCWAGARATYGVTRAKAYYEVKLVEEMPVDFGDDHQETDPYIIRVGWSIDLSSFQLGEEPYSYGYGGTGKFSTNNKFTNYGERFGVGDVIGAMLDLDSRPPSLSFTKNGRWLGVAAQLHNYPINKREMALFPHILTKNTRFEVNFGQQAPWFPPPHGFLYMQQYPLHERVRGLTAPNKKSDCEMMMIIGLPGAGKTTWGKTMERDHPDKRYNIIGTDTLIDKMKVMGLPRKNNYHGRWDVLIDKATKCLNKMFEIASRRKRNYILDQTNVYPSARRRKMKNFKGFIRKAAIIQPDDTELSRRSDKRTYEDGKYVPEDAVLEMKANFKLPPENDENFDVIEFVELPRDKAQVLVEQYNKEGQSKRPPSANRQGGNATGFNKSNDRFKPPSDLRQGTQQYQQQPGQPQGTQPKPPLPPNPYGVPLTHGSLQPPPPPPSEQSQYGRDRWGQQISLNEPAEKRARYDPSGGSALDFIKQEYSGDADQSADHIREQHSDWQHAGAPQQDSRIKTEAPWKPTAGGGGQYQGQYGGYGYAGQYEGQTYIAQGDPGAYVAPKQQTLQQQPQTGNYGQQKMMPAYGEQKQSQSGGFSHQSQNQGGSYSNQEDKWQNYQQKQISEQEGWGKDRKPAMPAQNQGQGQQRQDSGKDNRWPAPGQPGFDYAAAAYGQAPSHAKGSQQQQPQNQWPNWKQETGGQNRSSSGQGGGQSRSSSDQGSFGGNKPQNYGNKQESSYMPASQPPANNFQQQNRNQSQNQFNVSQGNFRSQSGNDRNQSNNQRQSDKQGESGQSSNRFNSSNQFSQTSNSSQYSGYGNSKSQFSSPPPSSSQSQVQGGGQEDKPKRDRRRPSKWDTPDEAESESTATPEERQQDFQNVLNSIRSKIATQQQPDPDTPENSQPQENNSNATASQTTDQKEEPPSDKGQSVADSEVDDKDKQDIDNPSPQNQQQGGQGPKGQFGGSGRGRGRGGFDRGGRGGGRGGPRPFGPRNSGDHGGGPRGPGAMGGPGMGPQGGGPRQGMGLQGPGMGLTGPGMGPGHGPRPFNPRPGPAMGPGLRGPPPLFQMRGPGGPRGPPGGMGGPPGGPRGRFQRPMGPQRWPRNH
ncbi:hypothetical protein ACJMK2_034903 [Sinanodonta woodiana]|uniref:B30.2/SPRY domain-containing protein n=1 Tax=Sinanodonta woodiana TaxID=1069815 RepID=A0ABD3WUE8_SINWO